MRVWRIAGFVWPVQAHGPAASLTSKATQKRLATASIAAAEDLNVEVADFLAQGIAIDAQ